MKDLLQQKLALVMGKGGVGKSTVSLALARAGAQSGKRTLHISASQQPFVSRVYERTKPIGYDTEKLEENLWALTLDWKACLHEYIIRQIRFEFLYRYVFENRIVNYFLEATPGLEDLLYLGKMMDVVADDDKKAFELVVVDLPATGHGLNMLRVPQTVMSMVPTGPLHRHAQRMHSLLSDTLHCGVYLVTLAEELAVNETIELSEGLKTHLQMSPKAIIFNGIYEKIFQTRELEDIEGASPLLKKMQACGRLENDRADGHQVQIKRLHETFAAKAPKISWVDLPFVFERRFALPAIEKLTALMINRVENN